jgi:hypothetical protein
MPLFSEELQRDIESGRIVIGGCVLFGNDPPWACASCGTRISALGVAVREVDDAAQTDGGDVAPIAPNESTRRSDRDLPFGGSSTSGANA